MNNPSEPRAPSLKPKRPAPWQSRYLVAWLPHLATEQMKRTATEVIRGEEDSVRRALQKISGSEVDSEVLEHV